MFLSCLQMLRYATGQCVQPPLTCVCVLTGASRDLTSKRPSSHVRYTQRTSTCHRAAVRRMCGIVRKVVAINDCTFMFTLGQNLNTFKFLNKNHRSDTKYKIYSIKTIQRTNNKHTYPFYYDPFAHISKIIDVHVFLS